MAKVKRNFLTNVVLNISIFRIIYICTLFLCSFCYTDFFATILKYALMPWGFILMYFYYIRPRRILDVMYARWLAGFLGVSLLTIIIHIADNFILNFALFCHVIICFFLLYGMHTERNKKRKYKELCIIANIIVFATTAAVAVSFAILPFGQVKFSFLNSNYNLIIYENRFTGIFTNPNLLGFYCVVAVFFAHLLSKDNLYKQCGVSFRLPKWFLAVSAALNVIAMFLSDSNGSLLLIACYSVGIIIYRLLGGVPQISLKGLMLRVSAIVLAGVIVVVGLIGLRFCSNKAAAFVLNPNTAIITDNKQNNHKTQPQDSTSNVNIITFAHENDNLDSGRLPMLQKAVAVFYNNPLLGVGKENIVLYADRLLEKGLKYSDLHNGYLTILVSNGLIGFVLFIGFAVSLGRHCIKSLFLEKKNLKKSPFPCLFAFIFAYCIYSVIEKTLLLEQSYMVVIFWYVLGYASCYMKRYDHIDDKFDVKSLFVRKEADNNIDIIDIPTEDEKGDIA